MNILPLRTCLPCRPGHLWLAMGLLMACLLVPSTVSGQAVTRIESIAEWRRQYKQESKKVSLSIWRKYFFSFARETGLLTPFAEAEERIESQKDLEEFFREYVRIGYQAVVTQKDSVWQQSPARHSAWVGRRYLQHYASEWAKWPTPPRQAPDVFLNVLRVHETHAQLQREDEERKRIYQTLLSDFQPIRCAGARAPRGEYVMVWKELVRELQPAASDTVFARNGVDCRSAGGD